ncbi:MAG: hypothetical protein CM15mP49_18750 [Actinomycetota bacterium]|nr:MAG: hypothetical protein CM15mP49_18750 [Actinomycetota bacterium]
MSQVDEYIPLPDRDVDKPFLMPIEDVFLSRDVELWSLEKSNKEKFTPVTK